MESSPGLGAVFTMRFPAPADSIARYAHGYRSSRSSRTVARGATVTALLVEDEAPVRAILRRVLERAGCVVCEARHGIDALLVWRAEHEHIDVLVTDIRMPEMSGPALVQCLHADRSTLPVVYVSGYSEEVSRLQLAEMEHFVEKPFSAETLVLALTDVLACVRA